MTPPTRADHGNDPIDPDDDDWIPGPDPLATPLSAWVDAAPVRAHLFGVSRRTGVPWWVLLAEASWPRRLARRMGEGPAPRRVPQALADALLALEPQLRDLPAGDGRTEAA